MCLVGPWSVVSVTYAVLFFSLNTTCFTTATRDLRLVIFLSDFFVLGIFLLPQPPTVYDIHGQLTSPQNLGRLYILYYQSMLGVLQMRLDDTPTGLLDLPPEVRGILLSYIAVTNTAISYEVSFFLTYFSTPRHPSFLLSTNTSYTPSNMLRLLSVRPSSFADSMIHLTGPLLR